MCQKSDAAEPVRQWKYFLIRQSETSHLMPHLTDRHAKLSKEIALVVRKILVEQVHAGRLHTNVCLGQSSSGSLGPTRVPSATALYPRFTFSRLSVKLSCMIERPLWTARLHAAWKQTPVAWLCGPRRVGKTVLAKSLPEAEYLNCDLPAVAEPL